MSQSAPNRPKAIDPCPLCHHPSQPFYGEAFLICSHCLGLFRPSASLPSPEAEAARYRLHHNNIEETGYLNFLSPILEAVKRHQKMGDRGLDYGSGPSPVLTTLLKRAGFSITPYDPFFDNDRSRLACRYDYIVCCEVIEHFHRPAHDFSLLSQALNPGGRLFCQTELYHPGIGFQDWSYKNDFTHTFFYQRETFEWIREHFGFNHLQLDQRLIVLGK